MTATLDAGFQRQLDRRFASDPLPLADPLPVYRRLYEAWEEPLVSRGNCSLRRLSELAVRLGPDHGLAAAT